MHKIMEIIDKEIKEIEEQGINARNLKILSELIDMKKDLYEIKARENMLMKEEK